MSYQQKTLTNEEVLAFVRKNRSTVDAEVREVLKNSPRETELLDPEIPQIRDEVREVLKNKRIKEIKHSSRTSVGDEEELNTSPTGMSEASPQVAPRSQENVVDMSGNAFLVSESKMAPEASANSSRTSDDPSEHIAGINVQHYRTPKGIKIAISFQSHQHFEEKRVVKLTGELKRGSRVREINKVYESDSVEFTNLIQDAITGIKEFPRDQRDLYCIGRVHESGKRDAWCENFLVFGVLEEGTLKTVTLFIDKIMIEITMDDILTGRQTAFYRSAGHYGKLTLQKKAPSVWTM